MSVSDLLYISIIEKGMEDGHRMKSTIVKRLIEATESTETRKEGPNIVGCIDDADCVTGYTCSSDVRICYISWWMVFVVAFGILLFILGIICCVICMHCAVCCHIMTCCCCF